jgi:uncharacterized protein YbjT (DUF2867 family)
LAREKVVDWLKASGIDYTVFRPTGYFNDITLVYDKVATKGVCNKTGHPITLLSRKIYQNKTAGISVR